MTDDDVWIGDPDPDCPWCAGSGFVAVTYEPTTNQWDAAECPCTYRHD